MQLLLGECGTHRDEQFGVVVVPFLECPQQIVVQLLVGQTDAQLEKHSSVVDPEAAFPVDGR